MVALPLFALQPSLQNVLNAAVQRLQAAGVESPSLDARLLMQCALDCRAEEMVAHPHRMLEEAQAARFEQLLERRVKREPVSHILGVREFWGMEFEVGAQVLDPRPDSETLVETVCKARPQRAEKLEILDLGTGSGCLLLSLLSEYERASGIGVDISPAALKVAARNASNLVLDERVKFVQSDWCALIEGRFDVVVSNPPYISETEFAALSPEVRYEPSHALLAGTDGLDCYRALAPQLPRVMKPGALAVLEIGCTQADAVAQLMKSEGLAVQAVVADLAGRPRCLALRN